MARDDRGGLEDGGLFGRDDRSGTIGQQTEDEAVGTSGMQTGGEQDFQHFAMMASHADIKLARLAQRKAQNEQVRQFATQVVNDHEKALQELQRISGASAQHQPSTQRQPSTSQQRTRPEAGTAGQQQAGEQHRQLGSMHQQTYDRLNGLSGAEFDREFMRVMVEEHQKAVDRFQQQSTMTERTDRPTGTAGRTDDRALNDWAKQTLPTLQRHLERARQIQAQLGRGGNR